MVNYDCGVSNETFELLKQAGYRWCNDFRSLSIYGIAKPTIMAAVRWLREERGIIVYAFPELNTSKFFFGRCHYHQWSDGAVSLVENHYSEPRFDNMEDALDYAIQVCAICLIDKEWNISHDEIFERLHHSSAK